LQFSTSSRDVARQCLTRIYGADQSISFSRNSDFHMRFSALHVGSLCLVSVDVSSLQCERSSGALVQIVAPAAGQLLQVSRDSGEEAVADGNSAAVVRPGCLTRQECLHAAGTVLTLPLPRLSGEVERLTGGRRRLDRAAAIPVSIDFRNPVSAPLGRGIRNVIAEARTMLALGLADVAARAFETQLLALAAAALFPDDARGADGAGHAADSGDVIAAIYGYILAHAHEPLRLTDLASHFGMKTRSLQIGFRRRYGSSPRDVLLGCRLARAREELLAGTATVTGAAHAGGFSDLSHFAECYRARFGELPSQTLRRARHKGPVGTG
jgi:AraC-like DNA-binding protein